MTDLREKIAELNLHYLTLCKKRDDYTPAMVEQELTDSILSLLASEGSEGYGKMVKCPICDGGDICYKCSGSGKVFRKIGEVKDESIRS